MTEKTATIGILILLLAAAGVGIFLSMGSNDTADIGASSRPSDILTSFQSSIEKLLLVENPREDETERQSEHSQDRDSEQNENKSNDTDTTDGSSTSPPSYYGTIEPGEPIVETKTQEYNDRIRSEGAHGNTGTFLRFIPEQPVKITTLFYRYCYLANTNGQQAEIQVTIDGSHHNSHTFRTPYTGENSCSAQDLGTFPLYTTQLDTWINESLHLTYRNGDWKLAIAKIRLR